MSEEFKLEDDAPTMALDEDNDSSATMPLDESDAGAAEAEPDLNLDGEEGADADADDDDEEEEEEISRRQAAPVSEGSSIGAFTAMLILSFLIYAAAAAIVVYQISEYSAPEAFGWKAPMP